MLTHSEVVALTGGPVRKAMPTGTGDGCNWAAIDNAKVSLLITLQGHQTPAQFAEEEHIASQTSDGHVYDLPGVADDAFAYSAQTGTIQSAEGRIGDLGVRILLTGNGASAENARQGLIYALKNF